jgi:hypothetical protein
VQDAAAETPPVATNGTRIRLRRQLQVGADGTRYEVGLSYYDQMLQTECTLVPASDGKQRCMPVGGASATPAAVYSDSQCMQPLAGTTTCGTTSYVYTGSFVASLSPTPTGWSHQPFERGQLGGCAQ